MIYRVLFGMIPMICIWMFVSGAVPVSSVFGMTGSSDVDNVAERVEEKPEVQPANAPYKATTPEGIVSQKMGVIPPSAIEMMEDNMRAVDEIHQQLEQHAEDERKGLDRSQWEPRRSAGWGRP